jgi:hypothetical protein
MARMRRLRPAGLRARLALPVLLVAAACATMAPDSLEERETIRLGARFALGKVTDRAPREHGLDPEALLGDAFEAALARRDLLWSGDAAEDHYVVKLRIARYEPGNAFKRWLLPGYGATILRVRGEVVDPRDASVVARLDHQRSVYFGGGYTIGAWKRVFGSVAGDLARDLQRHAEGAGFFVSLAPWASRDIEVPAAERPLTLSLGPFDDRRPERGRIGERQAAFGVSMGDIYFARDVAAFLREAVADDLRAAGHRVVESGAPEEVVGEVTRFWVRTDTTALYWDVVAEIALRLSLRPSHGPLRTTAHACEGRERSYVWPSNAVVEEALDACLVQLLEAVRSDPIWRSAAAAPPAPTAATR